MESLIMTADELREYVSHLPDHVILRVTIQEVFNDSEETEEV